MRSRRRCISRRLCAAAEALRTGATAADVAAVSAEAPGLEWKNGDITAVNGT